VLASADAAGIAAGRTINEMGSRATATRLLALPRIGLSRMHIEDMQMLLVWIISGSGFRSVYHLGLL
jgi:hypothetical protein